MFEYTCPACRTNTSAKSVESGTVTACRACGRKLRVVFDDEDDAGESSASGVQAATGSWMSPWLVAAGGVPGVIGAVLIVVLWFTFGRGAAPAAAGAVAQANPPPDVQGEGPRLVGKGQAPLETGKGASSDPKNKNVGENDLKLEDLGDVGSDSGAMSGEKIYQRLLKSCVWIVAGDGTTVKAKDGTAHERMWAGSGSVIDLPERLVVTNEHVANATCTRISVLFPVFRDGKLITESKFYWDEYAKGNAIPAKLVLADRQRDLALIQLDRPPPEAVPLRVGTRPPNPGQKVYTIGGNPEGNQGAWIPSDGSVRQVSFQTWNYGDGYSRSAELIASQVPINHGDSGGPLVDGRCVLVGINNGGAEGQLNATHISVSEVRGFIAGYFRDARKEWKEAPDPAADAVAGATVAKLIKGLEARDAAVRERAARLLAALGPPAREAVPALLKALRATDEGDRNRDFLKKALSEIGPPDKAALPDLTAALADRNCIPARQYAADALGKLGDGVKGAAAALVPALKDDDRGVRRNAAASLGRLGTAAREEAFDSLFALLRDRDAEVRQAAKGALIMMGKPPTDVASLKAQVADTTAPQEARHYAVIILQMFPDEAVPVLINILTNEKDPLLAGEAAFVLGHLKADTREVGEALAKAVEHKEKYVRMWASRAIRDIGLDQRTLPAFMKALSSPEEDIRDAALSGMRNISTFLKDRPTLTLTKDTVGILVPGLNSPQPYARLFAAFGLSSLKADAASAVPELRAALAREQNMDPALSPMIRLELLAALAEIGPAALPVLGTDADKFLDELKDIANETDDRARQQRTCAALALGKIAPDKPQSRATISVLVKALRLPNFNKTHFLVDDELSERAAKALIKAGKFAAAPIAQTCFAQFAWRTEDPQQTKLEKQYASRKAFEVLEAIGTDAACQSVRQLLQAAIRNPDEASNVKDAAASAYFAIYGRK